MKTDKKNLIYIFPYSVSAWDAERYGFDLLITKGINVIVLDVSALVLTRVNNQKNALSAPYIKKISSYQALAVEIEQNVKHAVFVDCINGINGFQWRGRKIFKILKQYNASYILIEIGSLPLLVNAGGRKIFDKIKKSVNLSKLIKFLQWKIGRWIVNLQSKYLNCYQLPSKIFVGQTELVDLYLNKYSLSKNHIAHIHSFDYDRYLNYKNNCKTQQSEIKTCVFLDQALTHHSDFGGQVTFKPVTEKNYIQNMNQFFDTVEKLTKLTIIIAASPRANIEILSKIFGNRRVILGKTLELVANCELVLMHNTTAVSFAILFDKPIVILKTREMLKSFGFNNVIDNMANALNIKPICIDKEGDIESLNLPNYKKWERNYDDYKYKYVQTKGLIDKTTWDIVTEYL